MAVSNFLKSEENEEHCLQWTGVLSSFCQSMPIIRSCFISSRSRCKPGGWFLVCLRGYGIGYHTMVSQHLQNISPHYCYTGLRSTWSLDFVLKGQIYFVEFAVSNKDPPNHFLTMGRMNMDIHTHCIKGSHLLPNRMFFYTLCKRPLTPPRFYTIMLRIFLTNCWKVRKRLSRHNLTK